MAKQAPRRSASPAAQGALAAFLDDVLRVGKTKALAARPRSPAEKGRLAAIADDMLRTAKRKKRGGK